MEFSDAVLASAMPPHVEQLGGDWDGSIVHNDHIDFLRDTWRLPSADKVELLGADMSSAGSVTTGSWDGLFFLALLLGFTCRLSIKVKG